VQSWLAGVKIDRKAVAKLYLQDGRIMHFMQGVEPQQTVLGTGMTEIVRNAAYTRTNS